MKHLLLLLVCSAACLFLRAQITDPKTVAQNTIKGLFKKKSKTAKGDSTAAGSAASSGASGTAATGAASSGPATFKTYSNYDFVPGEQVVFEDDFTDDQDGEFPAHWRLNKGQAIVNKIDSVQAFFLTEGNYVRVDPRMKT